jgi:hypothetical protein
MILEILFALGFKDIFLNKILSNYYIGWSSIQVSIAQIS